MEIIDIFFFKEAMSGGGCNHKVGGRQSDRLKANKLSTCKRFIK